MISAGRVLIIPKGAWNDTDTYSMLDLVSYNGSSYIAKTSVPANTLPTNASYWQLSAYGGSAANLAGNFAPLETTDYASQGYAVGDFLVNKDNQFCKVTSIITIGDELILKPNDNYNIEADNVGEEINAIKEDLEDLDDNVDSIYEIMGQNGCKNILPNYATPFSGGGADVAIDKDGIITVTASSALTGNCNIYPVYNDDVEEYKRYYLKAGSYKASGCPSGGSSSTYYIDFYDQTNNARLDYDYGDGIEFTLNSDTWVIVRASVRSGYTISGSVVFKPMITLATDTPSDYAHFVPYAMTNRELTEDVTSQEIAITPNSDYVTSSSVNVYKLGKLRFLEGYFFTRDVPQHTVLFTVDAKPLSNNTYLIFAKGDGTFYLGKVDSNKQIQLDSSTSMSAGAYAIMGSYLVE